MSTKFQSSINLRNGTGSASAADLNAEIAARIAGDASTLSSANANATSLVNAEAATRGAADTAEATARANGDTATLAAANTYTDARAINPQAPTARSLALATAYQATSTTKPAFISVMVEATYTVTVASAQTDTMELWIGPTAAVATGSGFAIATWRSGLTGIALTIGLASIDRGQLAAMLPIGWFFAVRRTAGTAAIITSAFDQSLRA